MSLKRANKIAFEHKKLTLHNVILATEQLNYAGGKI